MKRAIHTLPAAFLMAASTVAALAQPLPPPVIQYVAQHSAPGLIHVDITVVNWNAYESALFEPSPKLADCLDVPDASRTFVNIADARTGAFLNYFCLYLTPDRLMRLGFETPPASKPKSVYLEMFDRLTRRSVRSNTIAIP